ncbi:hypothetical protein H0I31_04660 [Tenacibaculum sp. AHE15PA]|uniref:hypothetical protein n=1 Tax=unclassified Tenacibaculum TaxID=2635139 RepID=UPI001C4ED43C|nr:MULTISPECIES: hypothetical protein [unclassified Tenacibaculum]QXP72355.1 hypothetical protein H0I30_09920 [Tenacibaculum sp. AHE14PA]QXP74863.1 hypothetical protein H0I31_04660 [Tenacibaculum sp. AHE15PA]
MKKVILMVAMVFATSGLVNANTSNVNLSNIDVDFFGCFEVADMGVRVSEALALAEGRSQSYEQNHEVWLAFYDTCMSE